MADTANEIEKTRWEKFEGGMRNFCKFLYNRETGEVMGRNRTSWAKIGIFYVIFYGCLAAFFSIMMAVFMTTIDKPGDGGPKLTQYIKNKPGLNLEVSIGNYNASNSKDIDPLVDKIVAFLNKYNTPVYGNESCEVNGTSGYVGKVPCRFDRSLLGACDGSGDPTYGLSDGQPCVFIRMNKVYDWVPSNGGSPYLPLVCQGANHKVYPNGGFQISAFPFRGQEGYLPPPVAIKVLETGKEVKCHLEGDGIKKADNFNAAMAFGNVKFKVPTPTGTTPSTAAPTSAAATTGAPTPTTLAATTATVTNGTVAPTNGTVAPTNGTST